MHGDDFSLLREIYSYYVPPARNKLLLLPRPAYLCFPSVFFYDNLHLYKTFPR